MSALVIGETLNGKYLIARLIGGGGMGAVYEAVELVGGAHVAIKVINTGDFAKDKALIGRFQREAQATIALRTNHIVRVIETGTSLASGQPFMVMEYLSGEDLSQIFKRVGQLSPELGLRVVAQACLGLATAHEAHVVHRDIKPANLFLAEQPDGSIFVKLLDFGIAKVKMDQAHETDTKNLTRTGSMLGSPLYMSPEQARGSKSIDHRADIWSLGVVFYQALAGRTPNQDIDALGELIIAICSEPAAPVQQFAPWVPPEVAAVIHQALRFDPAERFQSAREMHAAVMRLLPVGAALRPALITGISSTERAQVAPLLTLAPSVPTGRHTTSASGSLRVTTGGGVRIITNSSSTDNGRTALEGTPRGVASSHAHLGHASTSRLSVVLGGAALVGIGMGLGVYKVMGPQTQATPADAVITSAPRATPAKAPAAPSALASSPDKGPEARTVKVAILPASAEVEVEGTTVVPKDGTIEITGGLGTVHRVRVRRGAAQLTENVVVTAEGALPARIELEPASRARAGGGSARPRPSAAAAPTANTSADPVPTFQDKFE
jgi:eukaryotic-like serine/threonine-protein kinase